MLTFPIIVMLVCWYPKSQTSTFQGFRLPFQALRQRRQPLRHGQLRPHGDAAQGGAGGLDIAAHGAAEGGEDHWEVLETNGGRIQPPKSWRFLLQMCFFSPNFSFCGLEIFFRVLYVNFRWCIAPKGKSWKLEPVRFSSIFHIWLEYPSHEACVRPRLLKVSIRQILNVIQREAPNPARPKKQYLVGDYFV